MKILRRLFRPAWKHREFDAVSEMNENKAAAIPVEEYDSALTEIELRDR